MSQWRDDTRMFRKEAQWTFWQMFWPILFVIVLFGILGWIFLIISRPAELITQVTDPDRIISNYEWFENTYNDALALDRQITTMLDQVSTFTSALPDDRTQWDRADKEEYARLTSVVSGLRNQRDDVVSQYNSRSQQITRKFWKDPNLPYQLTIEDDKVQEIWINES